MATVNVLLLLLSHLFFTSNFVVFVDGGRGQEYLLPQGAGYSSYATDGCSVELQCCECMAPKFYIFNQ